MSKIKAIDFERYVNHVSEKASIILNTKNITGSENKSLDTKIAMFNSLNPLDKELEYHEDVLFKQLREDYEKDPLLKRNGGTYDACQYQVIPAIDTAAALYRTSCFVITSDGQEIQSKDTSGVTYYITFDASKDLTLEDGTKVRWIKLYGTNSACHNIWNFYYQYYPTGYNSAYFILFGNSDALNYGYSTGQSGHSSLCNIRELVFGYDLAYCLSIACKPLLYSYYKGLITPHGIFTYETLFNTWLHEQPIINLYGASLKSPVSTELFQQLYSNYNLSGESIGYPLLSYVTGDLIDLSSNPTFTYYKTSLIDSNTKIRKIILNPKANNHANIFNTNVNPLEYPLSEIVFYDNIDIPNLTLEKLGHLKGSSILDLFHKLKDRTLEEPANIILGPYNIHKVSDEDKLIAINKNWTIS